MRDHSGEVTPIGESLKERGRSFKKRENSERILEIREAKETDQWGLAKGFPMFEGKGRGNKEGQSRGKSVCDGKSSGNNCGIYLGGGKLSDPLFRGMRGGWLAGNPGSVIWGQKKGKMEGIYGSRVGNHGSWRGKKK